MPVTRVAACHLAPVSLNARAAADGIMTHVRQAAADAANLVVFPEAYISAFPLWSALRPPTENHDLLHRMVAESVYADGEEVQTLRETAPVISVGISEKTRSGVACLYNSDLVISERGQVAAHHRKPMPTLFEKLIGSPGDGFGLRVADTPSGRIGGLICGENTNPLARYSLMAQREQIHISSWPPMWPTRLNTTPGVAEAVKSKPNYDDVLADRIRAAAHCFEAKAFGIMCSAFLDERGIDAVTEGASDPDLVRRELRIGPRGATMVLDPTGAPCPSFMVDKSTGEHMPVDYLQNEQGVLYPDIELDRCIEGKQYHDVVGGYQRLDVLKLEVNRTRRNPVMFTEDTSPQLEHAHSNWQVPE
ncbi:Carbon-nitrogen hydrolase [Geosmithia morbida]|uniref:Carbon-nitrogen hydrolase n=1 Tax=Geosmithia morbida TaxID=1094350 RepID=A0A9P4YPQ0_9HYPO|nr:Carbon-nitrogen hydrolase [Geosmithia morbida]KAF4120846.1 Carbon-nitrogen hydrolase [Geosmithia morbida]